MPPVPPKPVPMLEMGNARKSLPMSPAARCWSAAIVDRPVGRFTPAVRITKSVPSERLPRICVSVRPEIVLVALAPPVCSTRARVNDVPTSKLRRSVTGTWTNNGTASSVIVVFDGASMRYE